MSRLTIIFLMQLLSAVNIKKQGTVGFDHFTTYYIIKKTVFNIFNRLEMRIPDRYHCREERLNLLQSNTTEHFNPLFFEPMTFNILKCGVKISRTVNV